MVPISLYFKVDNMTEEIKKAGTNIKCNTGIKIEKVAAKNKSANTFKLRFSLSPVRNNCTDIFEFVIH